jgi:hypothetical protein
MEMNPATLRSRIVIAIKSIPRFLLSFSVANPVMVPFPPARPFFSKRYP